MKTWTYSAIMAYAFVAWWPAYGQMAAPVATNLAITAHLKITITGSKAELPIAATLPTRYY